MSPSRRLPRFLPALVGCALVLMACAMAGPAWGASGSFGELKRFGGRGNKEGKFALREETDAFGVDPTEANSVYVGDEPSEESETFRIQKLSSVGAFEASTTIHPGQKDVEEETFIEGFAFDTVKNEANESERRVYLLASAERSETSTIDSGDATAGTLYAFKTTPSSGKLVPALGTTGAGVLATPEKLHARSEVPGEALLEPSGITVDPVTHEVIVLGVVDEGEEHLHIALQRINAKGELGARYIDPEEEEGDEPNSPVVSQTGQIFIQEYGRIVQIPSNFSSTSAPTVVYQLEPTELLLEMGDSESQYGNGLTLIPGTGEEATLYADAKIGQEGGASPLGVLVLDYHGEAASVKMTEVGWLGGQSEGAKKPKCVINKETKGGLPPENYPQLAAGTGEALFVLDPAVTEVIEFGPDAKPEGCPVAESTAPVAELEGHEVIEVPVGKQVTLTSQVTGANALSTDWNFGEEGETNVEEDQHQSPQLGHVFTEDGTKTIKETIHTDDLAAPVLTKEFVLKVESSPPKAQFSAPAEVTVGTAATFNASSSSDPNGPKALPLKYEWNFGDGHSETTSTATAAHTFATANSYTVSLTVTDKQGNKSALVSHIVKVNAEATKEETKPEAKKEETQTGTTGTTTTSTGPPPAEGGVKGFTEIHDPDAKLASTSLQVSRTGAVVVKVNCPTGESSCTGTITLRTLTAVIASAKKHKAILTLATGSFTVTGGQTKALTLHLSTTARALLAHAHVLHVRATIAAHDPSGAKHTGLTTITLRAPVPAHHKG